MAEELVHHQKDEILGVAPHVQQEHVAELPAVGTPSGNDLTAFDIPAHLLIGEGDPNATAVVPVPPSVEGEELLPQFELSAYRWQQNGRKISKLADGKEVRRQHWRCSNWDKPSKEKGCKAKFRIDITADGPESEPIKSDIPHNHLPPPEKGRVDMETQFQMAVRPLKHREKASSPSKDDGASPYKRQRIEPAKVDSSQQWGALNSVMKLSETYGERFIRKVDFLPKLHAIFSSPESFEDLLNNGDTVWVSSELLSHLSLTLVVFSMLVEGGETDVLWMISNARESEDYKSMLEYIISISEGRFKPTNIVLGPDCAAVRDAFAQLLPNSALLPSALADNQPATIVPHSPITAAILQCLGRPPV